MIRSWPSSRLAALAVVLVASPAACGSDATSSSENTAARESVTISTDQGAVEAVATIDVSMQLIAFRPATVSVESGQTIRWTQNDPGTHTVTSGTVVEAGGGVTTEPDGRFDSGEVGTGETFELTLSDRGTYEYFCAIHPATMRGAIEVS